ncbi:MAG: peroxiredoxin-like family protein, partial [Myxococcota bacterium]
MSIKPREKTPELSVDLVGGGNWTLSAQTPENLTMIVAYRGFHCPVCKSYTRQLDRLVEDYNQLGVTVVTLSMDSQERAEKTREEWGIKHVPIGYGLTLETARAWGLYTSKAIKDNEPEVFSEPGLFLIKPDGTLYL